MSAAAAPVPAPDYDLERTRAQVRATLVRLQGESKSPDSRLFKLRTRMAQRAYSEKELDPAPTEKALGPNDTHPPDYAADDD